VSASMITPKTISYDVSGITSQLFSGNIRAINMIKKGG
jgi:hypothetical protein